MHGSSVLIVEDDPALLRGLKDNFEAQNYRVQLARDGREGLAAALANPPDLVILDIMLPKINGYEICRALLRLLGGVPSIETMRSPARIPAANAGEPGIGVRTNTSPASTPSTAPIPATFCST